MEPLPFDRLRLIQNLIALEDWGMLLSQIEKLKEFESLSDLTNALHKERYGDAASLIDTILHSSSTVEIYEDPEIKGLRLEIKKLSAA